MNPEQNKTLTPKFHSALWWVIVILFVTLSFEPFLPDILGGALPLYGVLFLIFATVLRAIVLAIDFYKAGNKINCWLSLILILLIGFAAIIGVMT